MLLDSPTLRRILRESHTIAMVGLSGNCYRRSFFVAKYTQDHGYRIIPVNPNYPEILGEKSYPELAAIPDPVDIVDVFRRPESTPELARQAVAIGAKILWLQLGIENREAGKIAADGGLETVMDHGAKIEHARLFGALNFIGVDSKIITARRNKVIAN